MSNYLEFLKRKTTAHIEAGFDVSAKEVNPQLFPFQRDIVRWALKRGRAAVFADCGMGKTPMQLEWARHVCEQTKGNVLILAPLAVSQQTVREGEKFGVKVTPCAGQDDVQPGINITNYEKLHHFDASDFSGVVLDESSILKAYDSKTRERIIEAFNRTPYRLACTATPAPNDFMELGNHAEFLGVTSRVEMLATYFIHDGGDTSKWRLKGHAEDAFWKWICSWAVMIRKPSDLGYKDKGFTLPPLNKHQHIIPLELSDALAQGMLFVKDAVTLSEQRAARRASGEKRVSLCADLVNSSTEPFIVWCELNDESAALTKAIPDAVEIKGSDSAEHKERAMLDFAAGRVRVLISKPSICGFGMNWQHCPNVAFVGVSHSYEQTYQAIRRCWRFGQTKPVECHFISAENEAPVIMNLERKEREASRMAEAMTAHMKEIQIENISKQQRIRDAYNASLNISIPHWLQSEAA